MNKLTAFLIDEQQAHRKGGLYHKTQVQLAYNSNRIEGSKLTEEQTRYIFETRTIGFKDQEAVPVDDIIETTNHFVAFDYLLRTIEKPLSNEIIKEFHRILKTGTADAQKSYFNVGDWKNLPMRWVVVRLVAQQMWQEKCKRYPCGMSPKMIFPSKLLPSIIGVLNASILFKMVMAG